MRVDDAARVCSVYKSLRQKGPTPLELLAALEDLVQHAVHHGRRCLTIARHCEAPDLIACRDMHVHTITELHGTSSSYNNKYGMIR